LGLKVAQKAVAPEQARLNPVPAAAALPDATVEAQLPLADALPAGLRHAAE